MSNTVNERAPEGGVLLPGHTDPTTDPNDFNDKLEVYGPKNFQSLANNPGVAQPDLDSTEPVVTEPAASKPAASKPAASKPAASKPAASKPAESKAPDDQQSNKATSSKPPTTNKMQKKTSSKGPAPVDTGNGGAEEEEEEEEEEGQEGEEEEEMEMDDEDDEQHEDTSRWKSGKGLDGTIPVPTTKAEKELKEAKKTIRQLKDKIHRRQRKLEYSESLNRELANRLIFLGKGKSDAYAKDSPVDAAHEVRELALFHADFMKCYIKKALSKEAHKLDRLLHKSWFDAGSIPDQFQKYLDEVIIGAEMYTDGFYGTLKGKKYRLATTEDSKTDEKAIDDRLQDYAVRPQDFRGVRRGDTEFESAGEVSYRVSARAEGVDLSDSESENESEWDELSEDDEEDNRTFKPDLSRLPSSRRPLGKSPSSKQRGQNDNHDDDDGFGAVEMASQMDQMNSNRLNGFR
jgi:hypothetical protein